MIARLQLSMGTNRQRRWRLTHISSFVAWYDPSDLTTLYQDAAMTTPVTADGDPVGAVLDKSGNGFHLTQAEATARPLYQTDGTYHWIEGDGVDDILDMPEIFTGDPDITVAAAFRPLSMSYTGLPHFPVRALDPVRCWRLWYEWPNVAVQRRKRAFLRSGGR